MLVVVGPVAASAALAWTTHMLANLRVVRARSAELPFRFPADVAGEFEQLLAEWNSTATAATVTGAGSPFLWSADLDEAHVRHLVRYWANLDSMTDDLLDRLGIDWAPQLARPFFDALAKGVSDAFEHAGARDPFADLLVDRTSG